MHYPPILAITCVALSAALCSTPFMRGAMADAPPAPHGPATMAKPSRDEAYDWKQWRTFWSFQPVHKPALPAVRDQGWAHNPIDRFVLAKLEGQGLSPAPEADKYTLLRRVTYDLTGLPPSVDEIRNFLADTSPDAYEKLVDRLLASPHYGERWGRHWLDVARYVQGRITFPGVKHTQGDQDYRDYVVRAFNTDKPYDRFVNEQLAGDLLPPTADRQTYFDQIIAPAFLSIGAWFDMETDPNRLRLEMIDEQINTTTKAFLGVSVACARCHDHKFDPIPASDYYALGGIFASTRLVGDLSEYWRDGRVRQLRPLAMPDEVAANDAVRTQIAAKRDECWRFLTVRFDESMAKWKSDEPRYRAAAARVRRPFVKLFEAEDFSGQTGLHVAQLMRDGKGVEVIETLLPKAQWVKYTLDAIPETAQYRLDALYSAEDRTPLTCTVNGTVVTKDALTEPTGGADLKYQRWQTVGTFELREGMNFIRLDAKEGNFPRVDKFRLYRMDPATEGQVRQLAAAEHLHPALLANFVYDPENPWPTVAGIEPYLDDAQRAAAKQMTADAERLAEGIKPYDLVIAVSDQTKPTDLPVHPRGGTYATRGEPVPRGVPQLLDGALPRPAIPPDHSGRLELARWLTDPRNPLTSRVMVNRIWHWHFGRGIVATTSDFGSRGTPPTNPELLDWLASTFADAANAAGCAWSVRKLQRLIVTSSTYRMSSRPEEAQAAKDGQLDPDDKLLSRFPRQRLDADELFDAMFSIRNIMPRQPSGQPLDVEKSKGRALYVLTSGRAPPGLGVEVRKMFSLFDYDGSGLPIAERPTSETPAQALFWLNSPLVTYYADKFAERLLKMDKLDDAKRIDQAYLIAVGRPPSKEMAAASLAYVRQCEDDEGMSPQQAWARFCQALFASNAFRYVD